MSVMGILRQWRKIERDKGSKAELLMKYVLRFGIAIYLICCVLVLAPIASFGGVGRSCTGQDNTCTAPPRVFFSPQPDYSARARKANLEGKCILILTVGADGIPSDIHVVVGLGMGLDEKAVEAVQKWRFKPGMREGKPVAAKTSVQIDFHLK